jgi:RNA-dependent RNA polymerase
MANPKRFAVANSDSSPFPLRPREQNTITNGAAGAKSNDWRTTPKPDALRAYKPPGQRHPKQPFSQNKQPFQADRVPYFASWQELSIILSGLPLSWGTAEVYNLLSQHGSEPTRIDMVPEYSKAGNAKIIFRPPPANALWMYRGFVISSMQDGKEAKVRISARIEGERQNKTAARLKGIFEEAYFGGVGISFGIKRQPDEMLVMRYIGLPGNGRPRMTVDLRKQQFELDFSIGFGLSDRMVARYFKFRIPFSLLTKGIIEDHNAAGRVSLVIPLEAPPLAFRKTSRVQDTHDPKIMEWNDRQAWYRQVSIESDARAAAIRTTQLQNEDSFIDVGRWLCYRFELQGAPHLHQLRAVLAQHGVHVRRESIRGVVSDGSSLWKWLGSSKISFFEQMNNETVHLPFAVRYQLEACISHGFLHESNLSAAWAKKLLDLDVSLSMPTNNELNQNPRATKLLEKVLESKQRFYNAMDIFGFLSKVNTNQKKVPRYCIMVRSATVTATTIYFNSPSIDTSNRVIRQFRQHEDRFLRVKFRDESYKGTIMNFGDNTSDELFTRVKRIMKNGIVVGDRRYEFLAYGNSQFREHGAYFFAPTSTLTTEMIRDWMGDFEGIKTVAKYASRIGQCFSTTRAMPNSVAINRIPDIERNGYCFTDGVGKISLFSAQITALEMGLSSFADDCPSVFQFRLGGLKGVLFVDPSLKGPLIEVRPSQEKFPAAYKGLEICRISQFATAYLNQQIVLVLSALGVPDEVFVKMLRVMLSRLESAMSDQTVAMDMLLRNIDLNQSTVQLASMIVDGFMTTNDPFFMSCLRLWRAWSIKYLKEKAKIFVEKGAFVLGCVDETGILKGHSNSDPSSDFTHDVNLLPEIFLQITDPENKGFKVIEGVCTLARNPSLHPGDTRVVRAVDVPQLRHMRNCVVLPSTGDRDIASMCSGGDLDGDDYLVMWDPDLLPDEWNHAPMDYTAPPPVISDGPVTVDAMTSFFVTHMKNDNLGRIATAHRYWADKEDDGVKDEKCLQLAALHSMAVDYAKTGVPAEMPKELKIKTYPQWADKGKHRSYISKKVLGQLWDEVARVPFEPAWELPFDSRVLEAYEITDEVLLAAVKETKRLYDESLRRLMAQHGIRTEFEIWTTFILEHNHENCDYKIQEELGEAAAALKRQFQDMCYEGASTTPRERDWEKLKLWVAAMYIITANEVAAANAECDARILISVEDELPQSRDTENMPLISFPWLFQRELGMIAKKRDDAFSVSTTVPTTHFAGKQKVKTITKFEKSGNVLEALPILPSFASTELETEQVRNDTPANTGLLTPDSEQERKDSGTVDGLAAGIASSATPASVHDGAGCQEGTGSGEHTTAPPLSFETLDLVPSEIHLASKVLAGSSAFDHDDHQAVATGLAEICALPAESVGEYQTPVLTPMTKESPTQHPPETAPATAEETLLVDVDADADDEETNEGEQVSPLHGTRYPADERLLTFVLAAGLHPDRGVGGDERSESAG